MIHINLSIESSLTIFVVLLVHAIDRRGRVGTADRWLQTLCVSFRS